MVGWVDPASAKTIVATRPHEPPAFHLDQPAADPDSGAKCHAWRRTSVRRDQSLVLLSPRLRVARAAAANLIGMFEKQAGLVPGGPYVVLTGAVELLCGIGLAIGLLTRLSALGCLSVLTGAIVLVNARAGFFWTRGGIEYAVMWALVCLCFAVRGGAQWSVDGWLGRSSIRENNRGDAPP